MGKEIERVWGVMLDWAIATQEELELITSINGYTVDSLNDVLYVRTGYRDIAQITE